MDIKRLAPVLRIAGIEPTLIDAIHILSRKTAGQTANEIAATLQKWVDGESLEP